jgi:hypothetical protein
MEMTFNAYAMTQFAIGNAARFNSLVGFALANVAAWQDWTEAGSKVSMAESLAKLKTALIVAHVPESSRDRFLAIVSGLTTRLNVDAKAAMAEARAVYVAAETEEETRAESAVAKVNTWLFSIGADSLGYLESYAKGGKAGLAGTRAKAEAQAEAQAKRASMTEAEAAEAAEAEAAEAEAAAADKTPRAKAARQAAAILDAIAKHGENMLDVELDAIAASIGELVAKRRAIDNELAAMRAKAEAAEAAGKAAANKVAADMAAEAEAAAIAA